MNSIELTCINTFFEAVEWCEENLSHDDWELPNLHWPSQRYEIKFPDSAIATMFALKWA